MRLGETYFWLRFRSESASLEEDQDQLFEFGALGTEEEGPEGLLASPDAPPHGPVWLRASFPNREVFGAARDHFAKRSDLTFGEAEVEDWDQSWRERQEPVQVTGRLTVIPPWLPPPKSGITIRLTAKMAFGTGLHESTQLAAELLESLPLQDKSVLDIGAGTGILALYAAQLGAETAWAYDIDPVAGPCLAENLALNPPPAHSLVLPWVGTLESVKAGYAWDILVCNMIRTEWWPFRGGMSMHLARGGALILSGQRLEDKAEVLPWLEESALFPAMEVEKNGWWAVAARK